MSATVTTLQPDERSPAAARRHLHQELGAAGLDHHLEDALLMTTELVTNAVVHAGTALDLVVDTTPPGLRVEVLDQRPGTFAAAALTPDDENEHGRGLLILEALASRWGVTHSPTGTSVWFELDRPAGIPAGRAAGTPAGAPADAAEHGVGLDVAWSLALSADIEAQLTTAELLTELVHRLGDALGVEDLHLAVQEEGQSELTLVVVRGAAPSAASLAAVARRLTRGTEPVLREDGDLVLPLRGRGGAFGVLRLGGAEALGPAGTAVARLVGERLAVLVRDARADVARARERGALALLTEASEMFAATLDLQLAVTLAAQLVVPRFARWAAVFTLLDREPGVAAVAHAEEDLLSALRADLTGHGAQLFTDALVHQLRDQRAVLVPAGSLPTPSLASAARTSASPVVVPDGDAVALPLVARRRLLGALLVAPPAGAPFTAREVDVLLDLARRAALAMDSARLYEERTAIAQALQASLLPPALPHSPAVDFGARYVAAGQGNEVGGDFYDVFALPAGGWAVAIGDVCGKGPEAAAITGLARNVLRLLLREGRSPSACLRELNAAILDLGDRGRFCTAAVATLEPTPAGLAVRYCVAGHPAPVLVRPGAAAPGGPAQPPVLIGRSGTLLGVLDEVALDDERVTLARGESVVLYTDGVTERRRGPVMFGEETLLEVLAGAGRVSAEAVAGLVERAVRSFGPEPPRDDLAVLVVRAP